MIPTKWTGRDALERELMAAEYLLDSRLEHAYKTDCEAIGYQLRMALSQALARVRCARDMLRATMPSKQRTLITADPKKRPKRSTAWLCDCERPKT